MDMRRLYYLDIKKLQLESEMNRIDHCSFMDKNPLTDYKVGLLFFLNHINFLVLKLSAGFVSDSHKTRYLRQEVMRHEFAVQSVSYQVYTELILTFTMANLSPIHTIHVTLTTDLEAEVPDGRLGAIILHTTPRIVYV